MLRRNFVVRSSCVLALIAILALCIGILTPSINYSNAEPESVYLGGTPIGIVAKSDLLTVADFVEVITSDDAKCPAMDSGIQKGDALLEINGNTLKEVKDISKNVAASPNEVNVKILRSGYEFIIKVFPAKDLVSGEYKLGLLVKNEIAGVGTVTFTKQNGRVCTLGHCISDPEADNASEYQIGTFHKCKILGTVRGKENEAGVLKGVFDRNSENIGKINLNNDFGVYGQAEGITIYNLRPRIIVATRNEVRPGKAYIYTTIEGTSPQKYDIEIVKAEKQNFPSVKGLIIRVTDRRLLDTSGGIVQGMSGSPIVQDGKLVGAVTHVFLNDAAYGYGIYAEWLMQQ